MPFEAEGHSLIDEIAVKMGRAIDKQRVDKELLDSFANLEEAEKSSKGAL